MHIFKLKYFHHVCKKKIDFSESENENPSKIDLNWFLDTQIDPKLLRSRSKLFESIWNRFNWDPDGFNWDLDEF